MERAKKILKGTLLAVVLLLKYIPHEQVVASVNIKEGVTHTFFSLAGEGTGNAIKFWGCRLSE